jgi:uncharacterized protein YkwD
MLRLLAIVAIAVAVVVAATAKPPEAFAAACASANARPARSGPAVVSRAMACLINAERRKHGLRALRMDPRLSRAAQAHSRDMVRRRYFSHTSPDGLSPAQRVRGTGYLRAARAWTVGENIAWGGGSYATPAAIVKMWMDSPPHKENILSRRFREIGIGIARGTPSARVDDGATYATDFGARG